MASSMGGNVFRAVKIALEHHIGTAHGPDEPYHVIDIIVTDKHGGQFKLTVYTNDDSGELTDVRDILKPVE